MDSNGFMLPISFVELAFKHNGRQITQPGLLALSSVKYFDVFGNGLDGLGAGFETPVMHQFIFEQSPEAFHDRLLTESLAVNRFRYSLLHLTPPF